MSTETLIEPEVWVEYHRQKAWLADGKIVYATADMPKWLAPPPARLRHDSETNEVVFEYLV